MAKYTTKQGDFLDLICFKFYGNERGTTEIVLRSNPHLLDYPSCLPENLEIELPEINEEAEATDEVITLWS